MHYETGGYYTKENLEVPEFVVNRLEEIVNSFASYRVNNKLLDIGCGAGSLLMAAKRAEWEAEGVELSHPTAEHLGKQGLKVFPGEVADAAFPTGHFDVVTAGELLEHVPDPSSLIAEIARVLRPGGIFWATTPHSNGICGHVLKLNWTLVAPPEHLHLFSIRGLTSLLSHHGFRNVQIKSEGLSLAELLGTLPGRQRDPAPYAPINSHDRVRTDYRWNEQLLKNRRRRMLKSAVNAALRASRLGDFLKIRAER